MTDDGTKWALGVVAVVAGAAALRERLSGSAAKPITWRKPRKPVPMVPLYDVIVVHRGGAKKIEDVADEFGLEWTGHGTDLTTGAEDTGFNTLDKADAEAFAAKARTLKKVISVEILEGETEYAPFEALQPRRSRLSR